MPGVETIERAKWKGDIIWMATKDARVVRWSVSDVNENVNEKGQVIVTWPWLMAFSDSLGSCVGRVNPWFQFDGFKSLVWLWGSLWCGRTVEKSAVRFSPEDPLGIFLVGFFVDVLKNFAKVFDIATGREYFLANFQADVGVFHQEVSSFFFSLAQVRRSVFEP